MRYEISEVIKKDQVMELVFGNCSKPKDLLGRHFIMEGRTSYLCLSSRCGKDGSYFRRWKTLSDGHRRKTAGIFLVSSA